MFISDIVKYQFIRNWGGLKVKLENKVSIITGAGSGIGRSIAKKFAEEGSDIVIVYSRNDANANETARIIRAIGRDAFAVKADVSNMVAVDELYKKVLEKYSTIDILVNNAGVYWGGPFLDLTEEAWDRVFDVDLKGTFLCTQTFGRYLRDTNRIGKVVNIGSVHGTRAWREGSNYGAAKAALIQLTRSMALELAPYGINVNLVSPGAIAAGPNENRVNNADFLLKIKEQVPLQRMGEGEEVANLVLFLASNESNYITGAEIVIDGGLLLYPFTV
jgi:NAD(P)-dependent dehydrogenase (short-subunit alcohol dehydrogenase family)